MVAFGIKSQISAICDKEQVALAQVRELEQTLSEEKANIVELEKEVDAERCAKQDAEELFDAQRLQMEAMTVEHYKECLEYHSELGSTPRGPF